MDARDPDDAGAGDHGLWPDQEFRRESYPHPFGLVGALEIHRFQNGAAVGHQGISSRGGAEEMHGSARAHLRLEMQLGLRRRRGQRRQKAECKAKKTNKH